MSYPVHDLLGEQELSDRDLEGFAAGKDDVVIRPGRGFGPPGRRGWDRWDGFGGPGFGGPGFGGPGFGGFNGFSSRSRLSSRVTVF